MRHTVLYSAVALVIAALTPLAHADTVQIGFTGPSVGGNIVLTYGPATDAKVPQGLEITGISGTFSDANLGISNAPVIDLVPINHATPEPTNLLAPNDFSAFAVASGLPPENQGSIHYDNLFYPGGSPQTASDYPFHGGILDIYGVLFVLGNGEIVNFWSNGVLPGGTGPDYGIAVVTSDAALDYTGGVVLTPEPGTLCLLGTGLLGAVLQRRRVLLRRGC